MEILGIFTVAVWALRGYSYDDSMKGWVFWMMYWLYQWIISFTSWTFYPFSKMSYFVYRSILLVRSFEIYFVVKYCCTLVHCALVQFSRPPFILTLAFGQFGVDHKSLVSLKINSVIDRATCWINNEGCRSNGSNRRAWADRQTLPNVLSPLRHGR